MNHFFSVKSDKEIDTPRGKLVDIGDTKLHIYGEGFGSPTIIFDSGHWTCSSVTEWNLVQSKLSKITRTIVYDRAGTGWSEESKNPRNSAQLVEELYSLLVNSGEKPPYVLVGHSFGALNMILFANKYPDKVAGLVLVDGGSVDFYRNYFKEPKLLMYIFNIFNKIGIFRVFGKLGFIPHINERRKRLSKKNSKLDEEFFYKHYLNNTMLEEALQLNKSVEQVSTVETIGNIPLVVITGGKTEKIYKNWIESQKSFISLSINSSHIIVDNSGHFIHLEQPEEVSVAIENLIKRQM